jgi:hypothetical protein
MQTEVRYDLLSSGSKWKVNDGRTFCHLIDTETIAELNSNAVYCLAVLC